MMLCRFVQRSPSLVECSECGRTLQTHFPPSQVKRTCQAPRKLTWRGQILVRMLPGDGVAKLASWTGMAKIAAEWEAITGVPCGCPDRQAWLNRQWLEFVYERFSERAT